MRYLTYGTKLRSGFEAAERDYAMRNTRVKDKDYNFRVKRLAQEAGGSPAAGYVSFRPSGKKSPSVKGVNRGAFGQTAKNLRGSDRGGNRPKKNSYLSYIAATTKCAGNDVNILPFVVIPFQEAKNHSLPQGWQGAIDVRLADKQPEVRRL